MKFPKLDAAIAAYLRETGKTQSQLAEEMGMSENTFSWKRRGVDGKEFSLGDAAKIADLVGESLDVLTGRSGGSHNWPLDLTEERSPVAPKKDE